MIKHSILGRIPVDPEDFCRGRCHVAAGILGAGVIGAGANIWGASKAADAQTQAANAATQAQLQMFGQTQANLAPFIQAGAGGIGNLTGFINPNDPNSGLGKLLKYADPSNPLFKALTSLTMPGADMSATLAQTPGYEFENMQGLKSVNNTLAARGLGGSGGAVARGAANFTTGLAQSTWQSVVQNLLSTYGAGLGAAQGAFGSGADALQKLVNGGANAAARLATNATTVGGQIGSNLVGAGKAQAGADMAIGTSIGNAASTAAQAPLASLYYQSLQNQIAKQNAAAAPPSGVYGAQPTYYASTTGTDWG